jgi:DNA integrity scanning protein DisA with diadenylate cyclase activity
MIDRCERVKTDWRDALVRAIDIVGGFTAVDGATVMNRNYELIAFGAKVARSGMSSPVDQIIVTEPVLGGTPTILHPSQNGGTRHLAAAQFIFDQRDAIALVASQDGRFTIFAWSEALQMVHAHRIDILLL